MPIHAKAARPFHNQVIMWNAWQKAKLPLSNYSRATTLSNAVSSLASTGLSLTKVDEREKQAALEEEQARLKALKVGVRILFIWKNRYKCS